MLKTSLTSLCLIVLVGCSTPQAINASEFKNIFEESGKDSAVSWWYHGQDESFYYLSRKYPMKQTEYRVSKVGVELRGMPAAASKSLDVPINLKAENVLFK